MAECGLSGPVLEKGLKMEKLRRLGIEREAENGRSAERD